VNVLLTGATGYVGRRLLTALSGEPDVRLRLLVRNASKLGTVPDGVEIIEGSTFDRDVLARAMAGVETAYYLVHSMGAGKDFSALERTSAENFRETAIEAGVKRIVYLGGLGTKETASEHLLSRIETGEILSARPDRIETIWFRAGIIIGSGSASFEIVRNLVEKLPILITPRWVGTRTQPIGIADVLAYLQAARSVQTSGNVVVDIGAEAMSFRDMLLGSAYVLGLRRRLVPVPFFSPRLSSYWLILMTPVPFRIARALVEGLKSETVAVNDEAKRLFPEVRPASFAAAFSGALAEIERHQVLSRWCDSSAGPVCDIPAKDGDISRAVYRDVRRADLGPVSAPDAFRSVQSLGGPRGWLTLNALWRIRGIWDKLAGGPGLNRGRRDPSNLRIGDGLDFWKVVDLRPEQRLLLAAEMKIPGKAWLEFSIEGAELVQTAHFLPMGLFGRIYWWIMKPAHAIIFPAMLRRIIASARTPLHRF